MHVLQSFVRLNVQLHHPHPPVCAPCGGRTFPRASFPTTMKAKLSPGPTPSKWACVCKRIIPVPDFQVLHISRGCSSRNFVVECTPCAIAQGVLDKEGQPPPEGEGEGV